MELVIGEEVEVSAEVAFNLRVFRSGWDGMLVQGVDGPGGRQNQEKEECG